MRQPKQFLIEGIDRLGKSTLIEALQQKLGYHLVVHYEKPKKLKCYEGHDKPLKYFQVQAYRQMFNMIEAGHDIVFDRAHLGEMVYAPMYRKYNGDYVLELEKEVVTHNARLVLLTTSDFTFLKDDGLSLDFSRKQEEQALFIDAFTRSNIKDKVLVDVADGKGGYRPTEEILEAVLRNCVLSG